MPKPQLADCPLGICKRLATKKSYSILWPPWKSTRSLLRTHLLFRGNAFKNGVYAPCLSEHCTKCQSKTNGHDPGSSLQTKKTHSCKWIQDRLNLRSGVSFFFFFLLLWLEREKNNAWYIYLTSSQPPPNLHNLTFAWPVMFLANKRLPNGNQILARIMSLLKSVLGKKNF